jgi:hypothetical protein
LLCWKKFLTQNKYLNDQELTRVADDIWFNKCCGWLFMVWLVLWVEYLWLREFWYEMSQLHWFIWPEILGW